MFDALTTDRPYRKAMTRDEAIADIVKGRAAWSDGVFDAFMASVGQGATVS